MAEDEQDQKMITVVFEGAHDPSNRTQEITLRGRESITLGGRGRLTLAEYDVLSGRTGLILTVVEDEPAVEDTAEAKTSPTRAGRAPKQQGADDAATADETTVPSA